MPLSATLPRHIQLKLEQTLAQWPRWHCDPDLPGPPTVVSVLAAGVSNFSVLVESGQRFVVRIDGVSPAGHGLNRQAEWQAMITAHGAGLSPRPRYFNPELGSLVVDYLAPDSEQPLRLDDLARLLKGIHSLPARHCRLDLAERILRYEKQLEHRDVALPNAMVRYRPQLLQLLENIRSTTEPTVLCHNDLLRANRIYSGEALWAIDWEYCAMGSPWYDLAVVIGGDELSQAQSRELLQAYLGRPPLAWEWQALRNYRCIYAYLELLWYLALQHTTVEQALLERKLAALQDTLGPS
jgi:thiamine kinase